MVNPDMRIGALTACGPRMSLEDWVGVASKEQLDGLEVACFSAGNLGDVSSGSRIDYVADTLNVDEPLSAEKARNIIDMFRTYGQTINSLGSYDNNICGASGFKNRPHLKNVIDAASRLSEVMPAGPLVATFVGADPSLRLQDNLGLFEKHFVPLIKYAKERGVRIMIENCPMEGWEPSDRPVNNLMSSPGLWDACFDIADKAGVGDAFGLEYDPSHRIWQAAGNMDLVERDVKVYGERGKIFSLHGKGASFELEGLWKWGVDGKLVDLAHEWQKRNGTIYEHAVPGEKYDAVKWDRIIPLARMFRIPFISIEIEDPKYKDMKDPVRNGELGVVAILKGRENLRPFCYQNRNSYQTAE